MADPVDPTDPLAASLEVGRVRALLLDRVHDVLDEDHDDHTAVVGELADGVAAELYPLLRGATSGPRWELATWALNLGVAARLEAGTNPTETGLEQTGLSRSLEAAYRDAKRQLAGDLPGDVTPGSIARPTGRFPRARAYPDAAEPCW